MSFDVDGARVDGGEDAGPASAVSVPVDKTHDPADVAPELAQRRSLLHGGTLVTAGTTEAVVVETGDRTELGRISVHLRLEPRPQREPAEAETEAASGFGRAACRSVAQVLVEAQASLSTVGEYGRPESPRLARCRARIRSAVAPAPARLA